MDLFVLLIFTAMFIVLLLLVINEDTYLEDVKNQVIIPDKNNLEKRLKGMDIAEASYYFGTPELECYNSKLPYKDWNLNNELAIRVFFNKDDKSITGVDII